MARYTVNVNGENHQVDVAQWYCQAGYVLSATLLKFNSNPIEEVIEATMNDKLCRCGTYLKIRKAIKNSR